MIQPTDHQIEFIKDILTRSIDDLISNDSDIFDIDLVMPRQISPDARELNRQLHETTINHRLAFYVEMHLSETELGFYNIDIEYNRYYGNLKILNTVEGYLSVRPDILVHSRINDQVEQQHYVIIEAKKGAISRHDTNKIHGFISDPHYNYLFGMAISYCHSAEVVLADLYYYNGIEIVSENIDRPKTH